MFQQLIASNKQTYGGKDIMAEVLIKGDRNIPVFTDEQLEHLTNIFPENTVFKSDPNELYMNLGARRVIKYIELAIQRSKVKRG